MLQPIHQIKPAPRASSIYCRWMRADTIQGGPLVALWIDREMRCFEREEDPYSDTEFLSESALEEPGGAPFFQMVRWTNIPDLTRHLR